MGVVNWGTDNKYPEAVAKLFEKSFYERYKETIRLVNMNFVIRVYITTWSEPDEEGVQKKKTFRTLVGGGQITKYMKEEDAIEQFERVLNGRRDKYTWWDRNVLRIEFIAK